jgi:hypothetical protein
MNLVFISVGMVYQESREEFVINFSNRYVYLKTRRRPCKLQSIFAQEIVMIPVA